MGGSLEAARDIFQDALIIYLEGSAQKSTVIHTSKEAYILGIAKHLWLRKYQRDQRHVPLSEAEHRISLPEDFFPDVRTRRLLRFLEVSGKKCMDLLRAFYYQGLPVKKVVDVLGYANEHSASVQKYKCLEKIRTVVKEKSLTYDDFTE
ncbi:MAG: sigma-70 family RNA polymerase sigma factor [Saprospiraceae bacterium]|nr:sigma-70 family RNA polymerase sigma factor [Saprospiraceae bacterium]